MDQWDQRQLRSLHDDHAFRREIEAHPRSAADELRDIADDMLCVGSLDEIATISARTLVDWRTRIRDIADRLG